MPKLLELTYIMLSVRNRYRQVFEGTVKAVSSFNQKGPFDVLPGHANFISLIQDSLVIHKNDRERLRLAFQTGVLKASENRVFIYIVS